MVLKGYPRLSETFIAQEILGLERRGLPLTLVSLRHPTDREAHPVHGEIRAPVLYLPEYVHQEPLRTVRALRRARALPGYRRARAAFSRDLARDRSPNRLRRFAQAMVLADELGGSVAHLHAHFLHTPCSVARYAALALGLPWSVSAHAKDVWTTPDWELGEKLAECAWAVTCTRANLARLRAVAPEGAPLELVYHGLDLDRFAPCTVPRRPRDGSRPGDPVVVLSVGRAVPKKGYDDLLHALAELAPGLAWRFEHIGGGAEHARLARLAETLGIAGRVAWLGPRDQREVLERYRRADLFALASRVGDDGDRDGLPNVLVEAQSQGLACLSTRVSAVPELIRDGDTGVLVPPRDRSALGAALARLIADPAERARLGAAGERRVRGRFGADAGLDALHARFAQGLARAA